MGFFYNVLFGEDIDEYCNLGYFFRYLFVIRFFDEND